MEENLNNAKINKQSATDQVSDKIISYIEDGVWKTGDKLPSESELGKIFGVNRLTIRLALQKLNTIGVLKTKNGIGTHVVPFDFGEYIEEASNFYMSDDLLEHVSEFRRAIELPSIDLAIKNGTKGDFETLKKLLDDYIALENDIISDYTKTEIIRITEADIAFHKQIVNMSYNTLFVYAFKVCEKVIFEYIMKLMKHRVESSKNLRLLDKTIKTNYENIHTNIYNSLLNKDAALCKKYYIEMIEYKDINTNVRNIDF